MSRDGLRESSVVTRTFFVKEAGQIDKEEEEEEELLFLRNEEVKINSRLLAYCSSSTHSYILSSPQRPSSSPVPPPLSVSARLGISLERATHPPSTPGVAMFLCLSVYISVYD